MRLYGFSIRKAEPVLSTSFKQVKMNLLLYCYFGLYPVSAMRKLREKSAAYRLRPLERIASSLAAKCLTKLGLALAKLFFSSRSACKSNNI